MKNIHQDICNNCKHFGRSKKETYGVCDKICKSAIHLMSSCKNFNKKDDRELLCPKCKSEKISKTISVYRFNAKTEIECLECEYKFQEEW